MSSSKKVVSGFIVIVLIIAAFSSLNSGNDKGTKSTDSTSIQQQNTGVSSNPSKRASNSINIETNVAASTQKATRNDYSTAKTAEPTQKPTEKLTSAELYVNGQIKLNLGINFKKNAFFSTYDVDFYLDKTFIDTLPHGENYCAVLLVSDGIHSISFNEHGNASKSGTTQISVSGNTSYSCNIEATSSGVNIMNQQTDYENLDSLKGDNLAYYIGKSAETTRCILKHASIQGDDLKLEYDIVSAVDEEDCLICIAQAALDVCNTTTKFDGIENILIDYNGDTIDRYGNSGKSHIADIVFSKRAISKINYSYFETGIYSSVKSFFDLSEVYYLIPALKNELF